MSVQKVYRLIILLSSLSFGYIIYRVYSFDQGIRELHFDILAGNAPAPWQYRFLINLVAHYLEQFGIRYYQTFALIDVGSMIGALLIFGRFWLGNLTAESAEGAEGSCVAERKQRETSFAYLFLFILIAIVQYWLLWAVYWHQVPYTLPSLLYVALSLWLYHRVEASQKLWLSAVGLLLLTTIQVFIRADIAFATSFGFSIYFLLHSEQQRWQRFSIAALMTCIAIAGQLVLTLQLFPDSTYAAEIVQLPFNFSPARLLPFLLYIVVYGLAVQWWWQNRPKSSPRGKSEEWRVESGEYTSSPKCVSLFDAILYGSILHLIMWFTVGIIDETRIFIPLSLPLAHYAARFVIGQLNLNLNGCNPKSPLN